MTFLEMVLDTLEQNLSRSLRDLHMIEDREQLEVLDALVTEFSESSKALELARIEEKRIKAEIEAA